MKRASSKCFVILFLLGLFLVPVVTLLKGGAEVSVYEQRTLASIPEATRQSVWDGTYFSQWETAYSDHIALRDTMLKTYTQLNLGLGRPVVNDLAVTEDKLLDFYGHSVWDLSYLTGEAQAMGERYAALNQAVQSYGGYFVFLGVPQQSTYFASSYPAYMDSRVWQTTAIQREVSAALEEAGVPFLNMTAIYAQEGNPADYYFKTDHHYAYPGAYAAYTALMEKIMADTQWELPVMGPEDLVWTTLPNPFLGSANRRLYALKDTDDRIEMASPKTEIPFTRTDNGQEVPSVLYRLPETQEELVDYTLYMGGDVGETIIQTNRPSLKKALIVGDSFTNALETLVWMSFDETRSLDYRHYTGESLLDYVKAYQPDVVISVRDESVYLSQEGNGALF